VVTLKNITYNEALKLKKPIFIDLRSPKEFAEDHIDTAVNLPLFSDLEREVIGKTYKYEGVSQAKLLGLNLLSPKLPTLINEVRLLKEQGDVIIYCWRGGLRSFVFGEILRLVDIFVYRLEGGYKSYRKQVVKFFAEPLAIHPVVVYGMTGVGKTLVLEKLAQRGLKVLDLEKLANHRGSVFGHLGLGLQPTQKRFESLLYHSLMSFQDTPFLVEGESRRIGKLYLPMELFNKMQTAPVILLELPLEMRVKNLLQDYQVKNLPIEEFLKALNSITQYLGKTKIEELAFYLKQGDFYFFTEILLKDYYDPLYKKSTSYLSNIKKIIRGNDIDELVDKLYSFWIKHGGGDL